MQPMQPQGPQGASNPAQAGGIIMIVCALAVLVGSCTKSWFRESEGGGSAGIGLTGLEACFSLGSHEECKSFFWTDDELKHSDIKGDIKAEAIAGLLGGLASTVFCILGGVMALTRKPGKIPVVPSLIVFGITAAFWFLFFVRVYTDGHGPKPSPGFSVFVAFAGLIGGGVVLLAMLAPLAKAARGAQPMMMMQQPMPMGQPMQMGQAPPCQRCGGQSTYVAQYQRWFCQRCQQYV